ncbi:hypothetical protein AVEN_46816-1 [Araneus ventricosus]|uniref:Uncharacterized protein n=1 Tax=Araneus ventricosus TaxID=182803 RepID=A0A4Y2W4D1_ARAVE|nr:hypothetical protein AVEN_46816-1 [Araneus ventricosus]
MLCTRYINTYSVDQSSIERELLSRYHTVPVVAIFVGCVRRVLLDVMHPSPDANYAIFGRFKEYRTWVVRIATDTASCRDFVGFRKTDADKLCTPSPHMYSW